MMGSVHSKTTHIRQVLTSYINAFILLADPSTITTQIHLSATEFEVYTVESKCGIIFCQKELRVISSTFVKPHVIYFGNF